MIVEPPAWNSMVNREITAELVSVCFAVHPTAETGFVVASDDLFTNLWPVRAKWNCFGI
jgi:hypothetical protein